MPWKKSKKVFNYLIVISFILIVFTIATMAQEYYGAKINCEKLDGNYTFEKFEHKCNNSSFYRLSNGKWGWIINYSVNYNITS